MCEQRKRMHEDVYLSWRDPLPLHFSLPFPSLPFPSHPPLIPTYSIRI